jgi:competence protein ComEC
MKRVFAHIGFSIAIALLVLNVIDTNYIIIIAAGIAVLFIASLLLPKYRQALTLPICFGSALFACLVFLMVYNGSVVPQRELDFKSASTSFYIIDVAEQNDDNYIYTIKTKSVENGGAPQNIKLRLKSSYKINAKPYQVVNANLTFYTIGDNAINSYGYWSDNIYLSANADDIFVTDEIVDSPWRYVLNLRIDIINTLYNQIGSDEGALAVALLTGYRNLLSDDTYSNFKLAAATHLMAVSGLHLTVITGAFLFLLKKLKLNDKVNIFVTLGIVWVYVGIAGFSKSVIRAGIMMSVMLVGKLFKRRGDSLNSLGIAVSIICLNPFAVYDVGAMLSVLAVLSLITLYPVMIKRLDKDSMVETDGVIVATLSKKLWVRFVAGFLVALSIMIYSLPVMYLYYGSINLVSLVSNIVLVPIGSLAMVLCLAAYVLIKLHLSFFALVAGFWNKLILIVVKFFASFKCFTVTFDEYFVYVIAGVLAAFGICFLFKSKKMINACAIVCSVAVISCTIFTKAYYNDKAKVFVTENSSVVIVENSNAFVYGVYDESDFYSIYDFLFSNRCDIDTLIADGDDFKYALKLINLIDCNTVVATQFDDDFLQSTSCQNVNICSEYKCSLNDNAEFEFKYNNDGKYLISKIFDTTLLISDDFVSNCDIILSNGAINDKNGTIDLSEKDIIYTVSNDNIKVRRAEVWQK